MARHQTERKSGAPEIRVLLVSDEYSEKAYPQCCERHPPLPEGCRSISDTTSAVTRTKEDRGDFGKGRPTAPHAPLRPPTQRHLPPIRLHRHVRGEGIS